MPKTRDGPGSPQLENPTENSEAGFSVPKWMLSIPESHSDEEVQERMAWVAARYSDEIVHGIAKAARFKNAGDIADTREFLLKAGYWFVEHKNDRHPRASFAPDRGQLERIARLTGKLEMALADMSDVSALSLWHPFQHLMPMLNPGAPSGYVTEFGLTIVKRPWPDGSFVMEHLRPHQIEEAIHVLHKLAEQAAASLPKQDGGQPRIGARQSWIMSAQHFWRSHHSRLAFDPRKAAFEFCYLAFRQLDGNILPREIQSAMRAANRAFPARRKSSAKPAHEP